MFKYEILIFIENYYDDGNVVHGNIIKYVYASYNRMYSNGVRVYIVLPSFLV